MSDPVAPADEPSLASRRRELEREFENKRREAQRQEQRLRDKLRGDREDWEAHRRQQLQDLANKTEALRSQTASAKKRTDEKAAEKDGLQRARLGAEASREALEQEREAQAGLVGRLHARVGLERRRRAQLGVWMACTGLLLWAFTLAEPKVVVLWARILGVGALVAGVALAFGARRPWGTP